MTKRDRERYRKKLEERLKPDLKVLTQSVSGRTADDTEMASNALEQFVESNHNHLDTEIRRLVRQAIARMDNETYGTCLECNGPIPRLRLNAVPWARMCAGCQEDQEGKQKLIVSDSETNLSLARGRGRALQPGEYLEQVPRLAARRSR